jgi:hypothetical protein
MGHRRNRKRDRRNIAAYKEFTPEALPDLDWSAVLPRRSESLIEPAVVVAKACGGCREFIEDQDGGRGTCLHPGSGVLAPWTDTPACQFFVRSGKAPRR